MRFNYTSESRSIGPPSTITGRIRIVLESRWTSEGGSCWVMAVPGNVYVASPAGRESRFEYPSFAIRLPEGMEGYVLVAVFAVLNKVGEDSEAVRKAINALVLELCPDVPDHSGPAGLPSKDSDLFVYHDEPVLDRAGHASYASVDDIRRYMDKHRVGA